MISGSMVSNRSMMNNRCMMDNRGVMSNRGVVGNRGVMNSGGVMSSRGIGGSFILDISHITSIVISVILHVLGSPVRKEDRVGALDVPGAVSIFAGIEVRSRVIVMNTVLVVVRLRLFFVDGSMMRSRSNVVRYVRVAMQLGCK